MTDHAVNEWTRDDLPPRRDLVALMYETRPKRVVADLILNAVVAHLNANGGVPVPVGRAANNMLRETLANVERDRDRLRRAHEIVETERDQAREQRDMWKLEHDRLVIHGSVRGDTYAAMVRDRDDWREKAYIASEGMRKATSRAEAAEARTTPAVSYDEILNAVHGNETGIYGLGQASAVADAVWSLLSGDDPAVLVVRESQIVALEDPKDSRDFFLADGQWRIQNATDSDLDHAWDEVESDLRYLIAVRRAREAEVGQATDPVEELAGQIESAARAAIRQVCVDLADVVPSLDPMAVERAMEVTAASRKVAAHILGQEADDE